MKFGEVRNESVVSVAGARKLGVVDDLFLDSAARAVLGFRVRRGGLMGHHDAVLLADLKSIGRDAVTVQDESRLNDESKFADLQGSLQGSALIGLKMITENGHEVGTISDLDIDFEAGVVKTFVLSGSILEKLRHQDHAVAADAVKSIGEKMVVVADDAVAV